MYESKTSINNEKHGITGSTLKITALVTMLIDHIAAALLRRMISSGWINGYLGQGNIFADHIRTIYTIMRLIGRLGFPLFIFLLVEGFEHTRNKYKYLARLSAFAVISEIPFDIAFKLDCSEVLSGKIIEFTYQNVFFTLAIGLLVLICIFRVEQSGLNSIFKRICMILILLTGMAAAKVLHTDYSWVGVLAIFVMYMFRKNKVIAANYTCITLLLSSVSEVTAFLILPLIKAYNGMRGIKLKYVFYIFYPLHLLIIGMICVMMGI